MFSTKICDKENPRMLIELEKRKKKLLKVIIGDYIISKNLIFGFDSPKIKYLEYVRYSLIKYYKKTRDTISERKKKTIQKDFIIIFIILKFLVNFFQLNKKKKITILEKQIKIDKHQLKNKKFPLQSSIASCINILRGEVIKITEIDMQMRYFETNINSIKSLQDNIKKKIYNLQRKKNFVITKNKIAFRNFYLCFLTTLLTYFILFYI